MDGRMKKTMLQIASAVEARMNCIVTGCRQLRGGGDGQAFYVTMNVPPFAVVVKAYSNRAVREREAINLGLLGGLSPIRLPKVLFTHDATEDVPFDFLCMEHIIGRNASSLRRRILKDRVRRARFAEAVADALVSIHENTCDRFGSASEPVFESWLAFYKPTAEVILRRAREKAKNGRFDKKAVSVMESMSARLDKILSENVTSAALIHGNLSAGNILADPTTLLPVAFTGTANAMYADRDYELFRLKDADGERLGLYDAYRSKAKVSHNCDLKCAVYRLWDEAGACIKSGRRTTPALRAAAKEAKRLLEENPNQPGGEKKDKSMSCEHQP